MPHGRIRLRVVIASDSLALVNRVATALEEAEMVATSELLMDVVADACESIVKDGMTLRPYAELLLREIADIAERPGLTITIREVFARQATPATCRAVPECPYCDGPPSLVEPAGNGRYFCGCCGREFRIAAITSIVPPPNADA